MAHFLIGGAAAQLEARDRDRALQQYQYERNMDRLLANDAYRREQDAYARQADEERWNYNRMNNDRQYRFDRDKFNWARQNADRSYALNKRNMDFNYERGVKQDAREEADRWALGLNQGEYQRALAAADGTAPPGTYTEFRRMNDLPEGPVNYAGLYSQDPQRRQQAVGEITRQIAGGIYNRMPTAEQAVNYQSAHPELRINPYQREAVRLRRAGEEQAAAKQRQEQDKAERKYAMDRLGKMEDARIAMWKNDRTYASNQGSARAAAYKVSQAFNLPTTYNVDGSENTELLDMVARAAYERASRNNIPLENAAFEVMQDMGLQFKPEFLKSQQENQGGGRQIGPGVSLNSKAGSEKAEATDGGVGTRRYGRDGDIYRGNVARLQNARDQLRELATGAFRAQTEYQRRGKPFYLSDRGYTREQEQFEFQKANQEKYEQLLQEIKELEAENRELMGKHPGIGNPQAGFRRIKPNDTKR